LARKLHLVCDGVNVFIDHVSVVIIGCAIYVIGYRATR